MEKSTIQAKKPNIHIQNSPKIIQIDGLLLQNTIQLYFQLGRNEFEISVK